MGVEAAENPPKEGLIHGRENASRRDRPAATTTEVLPAICSRTFSSRRSTKPPTRRTETRSTSAKCSSTPCRGPKSSPATWNAQSRPGKPRSTASSASSSTRSCTTRSSRSSKAPGAACTTWSTSPRRASTLKIRVLNVSEEDAVQGPGKGRRVRPEHAVQEGLRGRVRHSSAASRTACWWAITTSARTPKTSSLLQKVSDVAAAAHAPFVSATAPKMFNMDSFTELTKPRDLAKIFEGVEYAGWRSFRESEDSRYVALTMPRVLARLPYGETSSRSTSSTSRRSVDGTRPRQVPVDERRLGLRGRASPTPSPSTAGSCAPAASRAAARSKGLPVHTFTDDGGDGHEVPDRDRHLRPPRVRAVQPRLPAAVALQEPRLRRLHGRPELPEAARRTSSRPPTPTPSCRPSSTT